MSKILVVGANGFVGYHLIDYLKKRHSVVGVDRVNTISLHPDITNIPITNILELNKDFDYVFLLNASVVTSNNISDKDRDDLFTNNIVVTNFVCEHFANSRIVYCSSVSVYASSQERINEHSALGEQNEYGISKLWAEYVVKKSANHAIVRCSSIYGKGMSMRTILPIYIIQALKEKKIKIWGDGLRCQDYINVCDVVKYLWLAAKSNLNDTFLSVYNQSYSNVDIAKIISKITNAEIVFENDDNAPSFFYNNNYTQQQLSYSPNVDIESGIQSLVQWIKQY